MKRRLLQISPIVILALLLALRLDDPSPVELARWLTFDVYQRLKPRQYDPGLPVKIVDIDDESLARLGQWPWPRTLMARLVDRLGELGVAVIAFDSQFAEPDRSSPENVLPLWPATPEVLALRQRAADFPSHDQIFSQAVARAPVVTGFVLTHGEGTRTPAAKATFATAGDDPKPFVPAFSGAIATLPQLEDAATGSGALNSTPEIDQVVRRVPLVFRLGDALYPSLAAEALRVAQGASTNIIKSSGASGETAFGEHTGINTIRIGAAEIPTDANGRLLLHYTPSMPERYIPAWRVLEADFDPGLVAGQIVFVGSSSPGLFDLRATPLNTAVPGVEIQAQIVEQILSGDYLFRPDFADAGELLYMLVLGLALILLLPHIGAIWGLVLGGVASTGVVAGSWFLFDGLGWMLDPVYPSLMVLLVFISATVISHFVSEAERRQVRAAFAHYLAPALVERLAKDPSRLKLGGEMREMTLLFCDIRGFTTITEQLDAEGITHLINRFLTPMTEEILDRRGTIDKYMGDNVMAFWNAPLDDHEHASHACETALAMGQRLERLNEDLAREAEAAGRPHLPIRMGTGINTGVVCVGNMGSDQRFDYSVLGDDVNLASRLEGQCKTYGVDIIVGEKVRRQAPDFPALELDLIRVVGKTIPARIYALLDKRRFDGGDAFEALAREHAAMLGAYRARDWQAASTRLVACRAAGTALGLDSAYDLYAARIAAFRAHPPDPDWDGVAEAETK